MESPWEGAYIQNVFNKHQLHVKGFKPAVKGHCPQFRVLPLILAVPRVANRPAALASPGRVLAMQNIGLYPRPTNAESHFFTRFEHLYSTLKGTALGLQVCLSRSRPPA